MAAALTSKHPKIVVSERFTRRAGKSSLRYRLIEALYRRADHITVNSHHFRAYYDQKYPWMRSRISTIWNGVDMAAFETTAAIRGDGPLRLLCVGNMTAFKNWLCVVKALAILRDAHGLRPHVDWVGRLSPLSAPDADYLLAVQKAVEEHRLGDQWTFLGPRSDIPDLLNSHHALVHPSYREGLPNVVCEALAAARPVLVSDTLDHPLLVQDGQTGFLFDWRRPESLAEAIAKFAKLDPRERDAMGQAGRSFAQEHLSLTRFVDAYENLFARLLGRGSKAETASPNVEAGTVDPADEPAIAR
jgi:glycosyltransferase involved in cell wall biosynthesis